MPMLDEQEFALVVGQPRLTFEQMRQQDPGVRSSQLIQRVFQQSLNEYERITGIRKTNMHAVWHHRISIYAMRRVWKATKNAAGEVLRRMRHRYPK
jgi:hypothetical protein